MRRKSIFLILLLIAFFSKFAGAEAPRFLNVDVRDHVRYSTQYAPQAAALQRALLESPCRFAGPLVYTDPLHAQPDQATCNRQMKYTIVGAEGPDGSDDGSRFNVTDSKLSTRENVIFSADLVQVDSNQVHVVLFIHDSSRAPVTNPYFFRKMTVDIASNGEVTIIQTEADIPLDQAHFSFYVDLMERKTVAIDRALGLVKVFPIAVGAFDVRTFAGMDGFVGSITPEFNNDARIFPGQPAGLHFERTDKSMYHNRPFLGIADDHGTRYREVGWHFKMADGEFLRGFVTHGCFRTEDKDLYQLAAIVFNSGAGSYVAIHVTHSFLSEPELMDLASIDHPMPKENSEYNYVAYANDDYLSPAKLAAVDRSVAKKPRLTFLSEVERYQWCVYNGDVELDSTGAPNILRRYGNWASALDSYCLTKIIRVQGANAQPLINYVLGISKLIPTVAPLVPLRPKIVPGFCKLPLSQARAYYATRTDNKDNPDDNKLTFRIYVGNCGCARFAKVITQEALGNSDGSIMSDAVKAQTIALYCPR